MMKSVRSIVSVAATAVLATGAVGCVAEEGDELVTEEAAVEVGEQEGLEETAVQPKSVCSTYGDDSVECDKEAQVIASAIAAYLFSGDDWTKVDFRDTGELPALAVTGAKCYTPQIWTEAEATIQNLRKLASAKRIRRGATEPGFKTIRSLKRVKVFPTFGINDTVANTYRKGLDGIVTTLGSVACFENPNIGAFLRYKDAAGTPDQPIYVDPAPAELRADWDVSVYGRNANANDLDTNAIVKTVYGSDIAQVWGNAATAPGGRVCTIEKSNRKGDIHQLFVQVIGTKRICW